VRKEVGAALQRGIPVIPIFVDEAQMPSTDALPGDLRDLSFRIGLDVRHAYFDEDMDRLVRKLKEVSGLETEAKGFRSASDYLIEFSSWAAASYAGFSLERSLISFTDGIPTQGRGFIFDQGAWWVLLVLAIVLMGAAAKLLQTSSKPIQAAVIGFLSILASLSMVYILLVNLEVSLNNDNLNNMRILLVVFHLILTALLFVVFRIRSVHHGRLAQEISVAR
jgi:hypothetical protein